MNTPQQQNWIQALETQLQQLFREQVPNGAALQVRCGLKRGELVVLTQHPSVMTLDVAQIFRLLEQRLRLVQTEMGWEELLCRLGLRMTGEVQPYATQALKLERLATPSLGESSASRALLTATLASTPEAASETQETETDAIAQAVQSLAMTDSSTERAIAPDSPTAETTRWHTFKQRAWLFLSSSRAIAPTALTCFVLGMGGYMLSRPCVVGGCQPLQTAQQQSQAAMQMIQQPQSAQQVVDAYEQLMEASYRLSRIPSWSGYHRTAQEQMALYDAEAAILENVVIAQKQAYEAAVMSQNPPHPLPTWRSVQQSWQRAIAQLAQVPADSPVYALAQTKQAEYQTNLLTINAYIAAESQAQERVRMARERAKLAETRSGTANSLEGWKQIAEMWQVGLSLLRQVPRSTMASGEAQQLLALYEPKSQAAAQRFQQEQTAADRYQEALNLASQAQQSERDRQWTQAVVQWQSALTRIQQVLPNTSRSAQSQPLVNAYRSALASAQQKLRVAVGLQTAQVSLQRACSGLPALCTYAPVGEAVQVRLTSGFTQAAQKALQTVPTGNLTNNTAVLTYLNPFLQELATIGETADLPIELYNPDGTLFGTYEPRLNGYVPMRARDVARNELGNR